MSENKHLTLDERNIIEQELTKNTSFKDIANLLSKDPKKVNLFMLILTIVQKNITAVGIIFVTLVVPKNADIVIIVMMYALILLMVLVLD